MTVLERQFHPIMLFQSMTHGVAGEHTKQLSACLLIRWRGLVIHKLLFTATQLTSQVCDQLPGVGQGFVDTSQELIFANVASLGSFEQGRRNIQRHSFCSFRVRANDGLVQNTNNRNDLQESHPVWVTRKGCENRREQPCLMLLRAKLRVDLERQIFSRL